MLPNAVAGSLVRKKREVLVEFVHELGEIVIAQAAVRLPHAGS